MKLSEISGENVAKRLCKLSSNTCNIYAIVDVKKEEKDRGCKIY